MVQFMTKTKIYLDTSVFSAYYDDRTKMRQDQTREFWLKFNEYEKHISTIVIDELNAVFDETLRKDLILLTKDFKTLQIDDKAESLSEKYLDRGIFPKKYKEDAMHLAIASVNGIEILVSWNFEHLVKRKTRIEANQANTLNGYKLIDIIAPPEL